MNTSKHSLFLYYTHHNFTIYENTLLITKPNMQNNNNNNNNIYLTISITYASSLHNTKFMWRTYQINTLVC